jgi:hypothetical protein
MEIEKEPIKESEITCDYCGPRTQASWKVLTKEEKTSFVCHRHHTYLLEENVVLAERRIGEETWEGLDDYKSLLNKVDMESYEQRGKTNRTN